MSDKKAALDLSVVRAILDRTQAQLTVLNEIRKQAEDTVRRLSEIAHQKWVQAKVVTLFLLGCCAIAMQLLFP